MAVHVTSDSHEAHVRLVNDGVRSATFDTEYKSEWNALVGVNDTVLHLGDIMFGPKDRMADYLSGLNGTKILIRGNHDMKPLAFYESVGFAFACDSLVRSYELVRDNGPNKKKDRKSINILFSHKPISPLPEGIDYCAHGHCHGNRHRDVDYDPESCYHTHPEKYILIEIEYGPKIRPLDDILSIVLHLEGYAS